MPRPVIELTIDLTKTDSLSDSDDDGAMVSWAEPNLHAEKRDVGLRPTRAMADRGSSSDSCICQIMWCVWRRRRVHLRLTYERNWSPSLPSYRKFTWWCALTFRHLRSWTSSVNRLWTDTKDSIEMYTICACFHLSLWLMYHCDRWLTISSFPLFPHFLFPVSWFPVPGFISTHNFVDCGWHINIILINGSDFLDLNSNKIRRKYWSGSCRVCRACSAGPA